MLHEFLKDKVEVIVAVVGDEPDLQEEYFDDYYPYEEPGCDEECWQAVLYAGHVTCRHKVRWCQHCQCISFSDVCCITGSAY